MLLQRNARRGFTLIELLVVIAIIALLSGVILVAVNSARNRAKDARVISDVQQVRLQLETGYNGASYPDLTGNAGVGATTTAVTTHPINMLMNDAAAQGGVITYRVTGTTNVSAYAVYGQLVADNTKYFCVDSTGRTNQAATANTSVTCP